MLPSSPRYGGCSRMTLSSSTIHRRHSARPRSARARADDGADSPRDAVRQTERHPDSGAEDAADGRRSTRRSSSISWLPTSRCDGDSRWCRPTACRLEIRERGAGRGSSHRRATRERMPQLGADDGWAAERFRPAPTHVRELLIDAGERWCRWGEHRIAHSTPQTNDFPRAEELRRDR